MPSQFQVNKTKLSESRIVDTEKPALAEGEILLKVDQFSFTANNITYGAAGDMLGYWQFFPAEDNDSGQWGIIPVWAMADVVESQHADIPVGERLYGYFPPADYLRMQPQHIAAGTLIDGTAHRQVLPPLYNRYVRLSAEPGYEKTTDVARVLLGPLHMTSFCLYDQLVNNRFYDAEQVIIVSASSKTSLGLAYGLSQEQSAPTVIGLTSSNNMKFVEGLGYYQSAIEYGSIADKLDNKPTVVVDMAGNSQVRSQLQHKLGDNLHYYIGVGLTHWEDFDAGAGAGGDASRTEMFFAPSYILERIKQLAPGEFDKRATEYVKAAAMATFGWMQVDMRSGLGDLREVYPSFCEGNISPTRGVVVGM